MSAVGFIQCGQGGEGFFRCGRPYFLLQKTSDFSKFMVCPHRQGGRRINFVRTSFTDGLFFGRSCATEVIINESIFNSSWSISQILVEFGKMMEVLNRIGFWMRFKHFDVQVRGLFADRYINTANRVYWIVISTHHKGHYF